MNRQDFRQGTDAATTPCSPLKSMLCLLAAVVTAISIKLEELGGGKHAMR